jgi:amino acid transporter
LLVLILGIWLFAGIGSLTAASRCTWALARDGAIPGHTFWAKVHPKLELQVNAIILSALVNCALACIYFGSSAAFNSFTGVATICLSASYCVPILVSLIRKRELVKSSSYSLGKFGPFINGVTIVWIFFAIVIFCMPVAIPVTPSTMNYASVVFVFFAVVAAIWYIVYGRAHFKGPGSMDLEGEAPITGTPGGDGNGIVEKGNGHTSNGTDSSEGISKTV